MYSIFLGLVMQTPLQRLIDKGLVWQGAATHHQADCVGSGYQQLDTLLGGGWHCPGLHEWQLHRPFSEQALLLPLVRHAVKQNRSVFWINPPGCLSAAGLEYQGVVGRSQVVVATTEHASWAFEQVLQTKDTLALGWFSQKQTTAQCVRRWYKAAQAGQLGVVVTSPAPTEEARAYSNRLRLRPSPKGITLDILKRKAGWPVNDITLN